MRGKEKTQYRIVHIYGEWTTSKLKLEDVVCLIENSDGYDIEESSDLKFFMRFIDDEDFEEYLKSSQPKSGLPFVIDSYYEYDSKLQKIWWHWDSHNWTRVKKTRNFYRTRKGTIGSKWGGATSPKHFQQDELDGSIFVHWGVDGLRPISVSGGSRSCASIKREDLEELVYEGNEVRCDCPFCGNTERTQIKERSIFACQNCRNKWSVKADT